MGIGVIDNVGGKEAKLFSIVEKAISSSSSIIYITDTKGVIHSFTPNLTLGQVYEDDDMRVEIIQNVVHFLRITVKKAGKRSSFAMVHQTQQPAGFYPMVDMNVNEYFDFYYWQSASGGYGAADGIFTFNIA